MTPAEFNRCVDLHSDGVYRFIFKNIKDEDKARDIIQDSFEKLWLKIENIEFEKCKAYLFTTAYRTMIDLIRRERKMGDWEEVNEYEHAHQRHWSDLKEILNKALATLSDIQRSVILLRDYEGYSYEEIGEITNLTESQVKVYIFRGRQNLKEYIGKMENVA
jgi:RNA polymerase sigma-70 factor (ECF subfamily)